jgi:hypothetical protein
MPPIIPTSLSSAAINASPIKSAADILHRLLQAVMSLSVLTT